MPSPNGFQRREAEDHEIQTFRHVTDRLSSRVWLALFIGSMERFAFYAVTAPWQNFMQNHIRSHGLPGALGLGQSTATTIFNVFFMYSYLVPVIFAIISDGYLGRQKTFLVSLWLYVAGCLVMFITTLPGVLTQKSGIAGLTISMLFIGVGVGGVKAVQPPHMADQYHLERPHIIETKKGERVIISPVLTLQYIMNLFNLYANVASISGLATAYLARLVGFWAAFLLAFVSSCVPAITLSLFYGKFIDHPTTKDGMATMCRTLIDKTKQKLSRQSNSDDSSMDQESLSDLKRALKTSRLIFSFTIFYLCYNQISNNLVSQAGQMKLNGFPNDAMQAFRGIATAMIYPLVQGGLYPYLQRRGIDYGPIHRAVTSFVVMAIAMAYAAIVQQLIYNKGIDNGSAGSNGISVWVQLPVYFLIALAGLFGFVSLQEIAYADAPKSMKALVQSMTQVTQALGGVMGLALSPVTVDPHLVIVYASLAGVSGLSALIFLVVYRTYAGGIKHA